MFPKSQRLFQLRRTNRQLLGAHPHSRRSRGDVGDKRVVLCVKPRSTDLRVALFDNNDNVQNVRSRRRRRRLLSGGGRYDVSL